MAAQADLVITTGGISVGGEDHVKPALSDLGAETLFSGVAIKPGKPVSFGRIGPALWLGLPGNPLSAFVTWHLFGTALLRRLTGQTTPPGSRRHVVTDEKIRRKPGRCELRPATLAGFDGQGREVVRFANATYSGRVGSLPAADGLIFLPAETDSLPAGALVEFQPFFCDALRDKR
jgi:molybdopterin molybdotransferase